MFVRRAVIAQARSRLLASNASFRPASHPKPVAVNVILPFTFPCQRLPCRLSSPSVRWLGTTRHLLKKDGGKDGEIPPKLLVPGVEKLHEPKESKENVAGNKDKKMLIVNPPTVQVFSDPNMSQTVRDVAVNIEKVKGQLKFLREEFSESSFEVLKLSQGRTSIVDALRDTRRLSTDNRTLLTSLKTEQKKMDQLLTYISKMMARHENQLNDARKGRERERLDGVVQKIEQVNVRMKNLTTNQDKLQNEVTTALADVKLLRNEVKKLQLEIQFRGREISELKNKSPHR